jgi:uncharacterized protein YndB with AHSA1/START domain
VNADPAVLETLLVTRDDVVRPHVVLAQAGERRALLVARIEHAKLPVKLGYLPLYSPSVRALNVVQGGALGDDDEGALAAVFDEAYGALRAREADVLRLRAVRVGSPLHRLATERASWATRGRTWPASPRWRLFLPSTLDEILELQSARTRGNHRRYARRLEEELGAALSFDVYRDPADLPRVLHDCAAVSETTYQRALGGGFAAGTEERRLLELAARQGWLRAYVLSVAGEPRAFWIGNAYGRVFHTGPTGYDPALASLRPGTYVLLRMLEDLCADPDVDEVDWGLGDSEYKRHFATHGWLEEDVLVFAPTFRGVRINLTRSALFGVSAVVQRVARRLPVLRDAKRRWRTRLAGTARPPAPTPVPEPRLRPLRGLTRVAVVAALLSAVLLGSVVASAALDRPASTVHDEMVVNAPRQLVWKLLTEFEDYDTWNPYITEAEGTARTGAEVDLRMTLAGETQTSAECDVITVKHLRKLYWRCRDHGMPGLLDREHVFRLLPMGPDGTQVRVVYDGRWEGILLPFTEVGNRKAGYRRMIFALKQHAELLG